MSPGRRQYLRVKSQHPDALLLFRMGDFYETFDEDARVMARVLDIALTRRDVGGGVKAPLAGIPHHALNNYLARLIRAGLKVAVCEQTSDPAQARGIVDRAVVRIVTPGTVLEPGLLDEDRNNYLAAVVSDERRAGIAYVDVTASQFFAGEVPAAGAADELARLGPAEVLADDAATRLLDDERQPWTLRKLPRDRLDPELAADRLKRHFGVATLAPYGIERQPLAAVAAAAVLDYLLDTQRGVLPQITGLSPFSPREYAALDRRALRDLEILEPLSGEKGAPTLLSTIDETRTPMGRRLLRSWLVRPLLSLEELRRRQQGVQHFVDHPGSRAAVRDALRRVRDVERLTNRARTVTASPRDLAALKDSLAQIPDVLDNLWPAGENRSEGRLPDLKPCPDVVALIGAAIADDPPLAVGNGDALRAGFDPQLDEVRDAGRNARSRIAGIEAAARARTGIKSLKVGYNRVFGYYIEVSKANLDRVPPEYERRQTLVNGERFTTPELKEYEALALNARDRIAELEREAFRRVCAEVAARGNRVMAAARALAEIDALAGLAEVASTRNYVRPALDDGLAIEIKAGRHPVVEAALGPGKFVPNDTHLSANAEQLAIITGPNMSGKSTYIRQVALLVVLAQIGSFVPADRARVGLVDRIFTRCNLSDDIAQGRSTFLVEMQETAAILHQATRRSLVVLDEIGRGTSTYDGVAIAKAVAEHLHSAPNLRCRTLFATHYHELTELADRLPRVVNYQVAVAEDKGSVVFLHRILPGGADRSYGVHVGRLAGLPQPVVARAWEVLGQLESGRREDREQDRAWSGRQLPMIPDDTRLRDALLELDISEMTPLEAISRLYELQEQARGEAS